MEEYAKESAGKEQFAGLDVSLKDVAICVLCALCVNSLFLLAVPPSPW
jgi:hypothetical protein